MYLGLVSAGVGIGTAFPNLYVWLANSAPLAVRGRALGGMNTALFLGQFLSPLISQPIVASFFVVLREGPPSPAPPSCSRLAYWAQTSD